jgi:GGDEF domain-containing protein
MINRKNISFFILFLLYVIIFLVGYRYIGNDILFASIPMILGASVIYNYVIGFLAVVLNIPATIMLMYIAGVPFDSAVKNLDTFVILLQCICVVVPGLVKLYIEKNSSVRSKEMDRKLLSLQDMIDDEREEKQRFAAENEELRMITERYKKMLDEQQGKDQISGLFSRTEILRLAQKHILQGDRKTYIFLRINGLEDINRAYGMFRGDEKIHETGSMLKAFASEAGRISGGRFLIIEDADPAPDTINKIRAAFGNDADVMGIVPENDDNIEEIYKRWMDNDRRDTDL